MRLIFVSAVRVTFGLVFVICSQAFAQSTVGVETGPEQKWAASWTTAPQGRWPGLAGNPALVNFAFPVPDPPALPQANNQTLRMILKPDLWGDTMRIRLSNTWGTGPVTFGAVAIGLQSFSGATIAGTNTAVTFNGSRSVTVPAGQEIFSDAVKLTWVHMDATDSVDPVVDGRNLAISMYVPGQSGPMTYHGNALQESFLSAPDAGDHTMDDADFAFPFETASWFFVDAVDVMAPAETRVLVVTGSSSADGAITTPGNNDRFLNWISRRLHAAYGNLVSVTNEGIGGDTAATPIPPQQHPLMQHLPERFERDVLGVSGVTDVLFYAGTNDFGDGIPPAQSITALRRMVEILHSRGIKAVGSTLVSNVHQRGTTEKTYEAHNEINNFILHSGVFDSTADFYAATVDPDDPEQALLPAYATHSDPPSPFDFLHLGRAGAQAEGMSVDIDFFAPRKVKSD